MNGDLRAKLDRLLFTIAKATNENARQRLIADARRLVAGGEPTVPPKDDAA